MKKKTVRKLKIITIILVVLGLSYAIAVSYYSTELSKAYRRLEKDRRPMEPADVIPHKVLDSQNAALLYESAALFLKAQSSPNGNLLQYLGSNSNKFIKETLEADKFTELKQLIAQDEVTQALSIIEQGTQRDSCRYDLNYDDGLGTSLNHIHDLRNLTFIICARARIEAETGNPHNAWDTIAIQLKFTDALWTEPIIISQLIRMATIRSSCKTIMKICEIAPPNEQQYTKTKSLIKDLDDIRPLVTAIDADRLLIGEWAYKMPKRELLLQNDLFSEDWPNNIFGHIHIFFKPTFLADHALYLRFMHKAAQFLENPHPREHTVSMKKEIEEEIEKKPYTLASMLMLPMGRFKTLYREMVAELRITQTGMTLLQYKQKHGAFPDSLEKLKFQNIDDPFSDGSLIYKIEGQNFILYSIGPDKKDNDGSPRQEKQEEDWDIVWNFTAK
jgi:hypothetical protein